MRRLLALLGIVRIQIGPRMFNRCLSLLSLLALSVLVACGPKASQEALTGYWRVDKQHLEDLLKESPEDSNEAKFAKMFLKMASGGFAVEFKATESREIRFGEAGNYQSFEIRSIEKNQMTLTSGKRETKIAFKSADQIEVSFSGFPQSIVYVRMNDAEIGELEKRMELAENGPEASADPEQRFMWLINAPEDKALPYLEEHPDLITIQNDRGQSLLHYLVRSNKNEMAKVIIEMGASLTLMDQDGATPFHLSLKQREKFDPEFSKLLYVEAINLEQPNKMKRTALEEALKREQSDVITFLFELGADPEAGKAPGEKTPLLFAIEKSKLEVAKLLIKSGADINRTMAPHDSSALHLAARYASLETIQFLLDAGMDVNVQNKLKAPPIGQICFRQDEQIEAVKLLVAAGADINAKLPGNNNLIRYAINRQQLEFAQELVDAGADFDASSTYGKSAYEMAQEAELSELVAQMDARRATASE